MNVVFDKSFNKSIDKIRDIKAKERIVKIIISVENADNVEIIPQVKKMRGWQNYYRIKFGDYRIGIELETNNTIRFIIAAHHKDIYRNFP
ncbi:MAG: type II toxin-antitoxin system RelE/ParE family toxin [Bacteroidales bacterium]|nr:type II toxin-antitoxin system RelE/ParE family toxin [Bacteroidales bacterium]